MVAVAILISNLSSVKQSFPFKATVKTLLYSFFTRGVRFLKSSLRELDVGAYFSNCLAVIKSEGECDS